MKSLFSFYRMINTLSLDVAIGAMICSVFFANIFHVTVFPQGIAALGLAVWIIYTIDHLIDAKKLGHAASTFRHQFHQQYFRLLSMAVVIAICLGFILLLFIRKQLFLNGVVFAAFTFLYILTNRWLFYLKELASAALYSGGVLLPSISFHEKIFLLADYLLMTQFSLLALINLILFSWMDYERDLHSNQHSIILKIGKNKSRFILKILFVFLFCLIAFSFSSTQFVSLIFLSMAFILFFIFLTPKYFRDEYNFRFIGDMIFFFPITYIINSVWQ